MPRFLSAEWVDQFNAALAGVDLTGAQGTTSVAAAQRPFAVAQQVTGGPDGPVGTLLRVDGGTVTLVLTGDTGSAPGAPEAAVRGPSADVTIALRYEDAVAMSKGQLDPATALGAGRVRVRGDLSVLAAGQAVLAAAGANLASLSAATTY